MNKELLIKLAALAGLIGGLIFFDYSVGKVIKKSPRKKQRNNPPTPCPP